MALAQSGKKTKLSKKELIDALARELEDCSYQAVLVTYMAARDIASVENSKEGKYNAFSQYLHSKIEDGKLVCKEINDFDVSFHSLDCILLPCMLSLLSLSIFPHIMQKIMT